MTLPKSKKRSSERGEILYLRVKEVNKAWVNKESAKAGVSASLFMDKLIEEIRRK